MRYDDSLPRHFISAPLTMEPRMQRPGQMDRLKRDAVLGFTLLLVLLLGFYLFQAYLEAGLMPVLAFGLIIAWQLRPAWFEAAWHHFGRLAKRRLVSAILVGLITFIISAAPSLFRPMPQPRIHDEFSFLLAADTFQHGRLANPTHPMWVHFETIHVIFQPTYASKYPPAQGLVLAAGSLVAGNAIVGVWLSIALAVAVVCWMLMCWIGSRCGLLGGLIAAVHPLTIEWSQDYWGGAVALGGGALLLGAFRRVLRKPSSFDAWLMGCGMALLAFSRPYEGAVLIALVMMILTVSVFRRSKQTLKSIFQRVFVPIAVVGLLTVAGWGYYNQRVTGNVLQMPVMLHERTYAVSQPFLWQKANPEPVYRHKEIRDFQTEWSLRPYLEQRASVSAFVTGAMKKLDAYASEYFQGWVVVLLIGLLFLRRDRLIRLMAPVIFVFTAALMVATWSNAHYAAPIAGLLLAFVLQTAKRISLFTIAEVRVGRQLSRSFLVLFIASLLHADMNLPRPSEQDWSLDRARILADLQHEEGNHLVIVRYGADHISHEEWVYNEADIDGAKIVWARDMGPEQNQELIEYFKDRKQWLLEVDKPQRTLVSYESTQTKRVSP